MRITTPLETEKLRVLHKNITEKIMINTGVAGPATLQSRLRDLRIQEENRHSVLLLEHNPGGIPRSQGLESLWDPYSDTPPAFLQRTGTYGVQKNAVCELNLTTQIHSKLDVGGNEITVPGMMQLHIRYPDSTHEINISCPYRWTDPDDGTPRPAFIDGIKRRGKEMTQISQPDYARSEAVLQGFNNALAEKRSDVTWGYQDGKFIMRLGS